MARLLVVDDEPTLVHLMRAVLERAGHTIEDAANGQLALAKLGIEPHNPSVIMPDLILLDAMMPVLDGPSTASVLRDNAPTSKIPILVVTAKGDTRTLFSNIPQVVGFFQKPFDPATLRQAVANAVVKK